MTINERHELLINPRSPSFIYNCFGVNGIILILSDPLYLDLEMCKLG